MTNKIFRILTISFLLVYSFTLQAQDKFLLQDKYKGFETKDGKGYLEIAIRDSTNIDSYIGAVYSTIAESYPDAEIQTIGTRVVRMEATSKGMDISSMQGGLLQMFVDFSIMIEIREHPEKIYYYTDSLGVKRPGNDYHTVRIYAPVIKKITAYNPYYKPEVKEYITNRTDMHEALMEKEFSGYCTFAESLAREINLYICNNINAELNQNYYRTFENGRFESLSRKFSR